MLSSARDELARRQLVLFPATHITKAHRRSGRWSGRCRRCRSRRIRVLIRGSRMCRHGQSRGTHDNQQRFPDRRTQHAGTLNAPNTVVNVLSGPSTLNSPPNLPRSTSGQSPPPLIPVPPSSGSPNGARSKGARSDGARFEGARPDGPGCEVRGSAGWGVERSLPGAWRRSVDARSVVLRDAGGERSWLGAWRSWVEGANSLL